MRIVKDNCAAIIIDIQERLFPHIHEHEQLQDNTRRLIEGLRVLDVPIMTTQQYTKGLGPTIEAIREVLPTEFYMEKMHFSCCGSPGFMDQLELLDRKEVILAGIETHVCVLQTALDLRDRGYSPVVVEDCVSSRCLNDKQMAIERLRDSGVLITTYESLLFELLEVAGTDTFKAISAIVK